MLWSPVITSIKCGSPPVYKCFPSLKVIECRQVCSVANFLSEQTEAFIKFVSALWTLDLVFMTFRGFLLEMLNIRKKQEVLAAVPLPEF